MAGKTGQKEKRLQPWDNCKRLKFGGYLPHLGNRLTPSVEITTWYLVAPHSLLQPRRQKVTYGKPRYKPNKLGHPSAF
jgi:hypothetical protein